MKTLGEFFLAKDINAIIVAFLCALFPVFYFPTGFIAVIIVGLVTLQKGAQSGVKLLAWVVLPALALLVLRHWGLVDVLTLRCFLVFGLALLLRQQFTWSFLIEVISVIGMLLIITIHFFVPDLSVWWVTHLTSYLHQVVPASEWKMTETSAQFATRLAPFASGMTAFFFLASAVLELLIARYWQSAVMGITQFAQEFTQIRAGYASVCAAALLLLMSVLKVSLTLDVLPLVIFPFFWAGLSLLHFIVQRKKQLTFVLILVYAGLLFLPVLIISALSVFALIDVWVNFRSRIIRGVR